MIREIDYNISLLQLQDYSDQELHRLYKYAARDKDSIYHAECTYWMCVMEINRREHDIEPENMDIKCLANIFSKNSHETVFRLGNKYRLYAMDNVMLVYNDELIPYVFTMVEGDNRCIWKYFGLWEEDFYTHTRLN